MKQCASCRFMRPDHEIEGDVCRDVNACAVRRQRHQRTREPVVVRAAEEQTA